GVTEEGNFEDPHHPEFGRRTVLAAWEDPGELATRFGLTTEELTRTLSVLAGKLYDVRSRRIWPGLDDKVLASWNGLTIAAFAEAGRVLGERAYIDVAVRNAAFLREAMWRDGRLLHSW